MTAPASVRLVLHADNLEATARIASAVAEELTGPATLALVGDLGSGKTAFTRAFVAGRGGDPRLVSSPTYVLEQIYPTPRGPVHHHDAYRLDGPEDLAGIGIEELFDLDVLVVVEWADRVSAILPEGTLTLEFDVTGETSRRVVITGASARWKSALVRLRERLADLVRKDAEPD